MAIALFFDVHVDRAIAEQLRQRQVDVLTAQEADVARLADDMLLANSSKLGRPLVTHVIRLNAMAESWQQQVRPFVGIIFGHFMQVSIGQFVRDLELIAQATDPDDWDSTIVRLPL